MECFILSYLQDRRAIEKTFKLMDHVVKQCQQPRLNLKNSPPFILDILPDTYHQLTQIFVKDPNCLRENIYLQLFLENVQAKCKQVGLNFHFNLLSVASRCSYFVWNQFEKRFFFLPSGLGELFVTGTLVQKSGHYTTDNSYCLLHRNFSTR